MIPISENERAKFSFRSKTHDMETSVAVARVNTSIGRANIFIISVSVEENRLRALLLDLSVLLDEHTA